MGKLLDQMHHKLEDMEKKAHELKGRAKQKKEDMKKSDDQQHMAM